MQISNEKSFFHSKITTVNFILAIFIMIIHSENIVHYKNINSFIPLMEYFISYTLGNLAVPAFFMISSYLFYRNFHLNQFQDKFRRRIKSIFLPYLIWNSLYFIIFYAITFFPGIRSFMTTEHFILTPKVIFESILFHKYNKSFWFMQQLIYFTVLSPLVYCLLKKKCGIIFLGLFLIIGIFFPTFPNNQYGIRIDMIVYWIFGCYFAIHKSSLFEAKGTKTLSLLSAVMSIILLIIRFILEYIIESSSLSNVLLPLLLFVNVPFFWFALTPVILSSPPWWTQISFFIYLSHPLLVDGWKKGSACFLPDSSFFCLINYVLAVVVSLIFIITSARFLLNKFPKLWAFLTGGRIPTS